MSHVLGFFLLLFSTNLVYQTNKQKGTKKIQTINSIPSSSRNQTCWNCKGNLCGMTLLIENMEVNGGLVSKESREEAYGVGL